jgi:uncharacterized protein (TIGR02246 family)
MIILPDSLSIDKEPYRPRTPDEEEVHELYSRLIQAWNQQDGPGFSGQFAKSAVVIGLDGTQLIGQKAIESSIRNIFHDHSTATYITKVREIRNISKDVVLLRSIVGMISPGEYDINPSMNAVQTLLASKGVDGWHIVLFQNTPARYDGRPEAKEELNKELRELI